MPEQNTQNPNPIETYVLTALKQHGFEKLTEEDQKSMFPQFMAEAEKRLGIALAPFLKEDNVDEFSSMLQSYTSAEEWFAFWNSKVPNFTEVVQNTLDSFAKEISVAFKM